MVKDSLRFIRKMSSGKLKNASQLYASYHYSRMKKIARQYGLPMSISIEPTTACNLKCPECPSGLRSFTRPTGNLKRDFFKSVIDDLQSHLMYLIFYFQGEPYINPEFLDMVNYAHSHKIYTITSTNGHFLNDQNAHKTVESGLDRLIISVDGTTQEVYEQYRKEGSLDQVIAGAKNIIKWKKRLKASHPHTIFQFLVVKPNQHQIQGVYRLAAEIGIDEVKLKTAQIYDYENDQSLIPTIEKYSRYARQKNGTYAIKNPLLNQCWKLWHSCVITWDGKVVPCCFDKDAQHVLGDLNKQTFHEIWFGAKYNAFRNRILHGRDQIDICTNCTEGCKVFA